MNEPIIFLFLLRYLHLIAKFHSNIQWYNFCFMKKIHIVTSNEFVRHEVELRHWNQIFYFYYFLSRSCVVTMLDEWLQPHSCIFILFYSNSSYANIITHPNAEYHVSKILLSWCFFWCKWDSLRDILMPQKELQVAQHAITNQGKKSLNPHSI